MPKQQEILRSIKALQRKYYNQKLIKKSYKVLKKYFKKQTQVNQIYIRLEDKVKRLPQQIRLKDKTQIISQHSFNLIRRKTKNPQSKLAKARSLPSPPLKPNYSLSMDDLESQTQQVGPSTPSKYNSKNEYKKQINKQNFQQIRKKIQRIDQQLTERLKIREQFQNNFEYQIDTLSVGTYVSIKKNKQTLLRMYEKIHGNHESYRKNPNGSNAENVNEVKTLIRGIVELIENSNQYDSAEIMKICVFMSNMILCVDSNYRDDFISSSKNIFQVLGQYFSKLSDVTSRTSTSESTAASSNSQTHEYQTLVLIYKLLMATRHPSESVCAPKKGSSTSQSASDVQKEKDNIIMMREKLIAKDFMRKIFEIDVEDFAPNDNLISEMWKMLLAFYTLFAKNKDKITQFGLVRNAKDKFLEAIYCLHQQSKSDTQTLHQAVGCLNYTMDKIKLSLKDIQKYNLVSVLCDLLENPRTLTQQLHVILKMFLNLSKSNLLSKNSYQTMCLGKAFKVFERAPTHAAELIADIYKKDPVALKDITLSSAVALLRGQQQQQQQLQFLQSKQQYQTFSTISNNFPCSQQQSRQQFFLCHPYNASNTYQNTTLLNQYAAFGNTGQSYTPLQPSSCTDTPSQLCSSPSSSSMHESSGETSFFPNGVSTLDPKNYAQYANCSNLLAMQNVQDCQNGNKHSDN